MSARSGRHVAGEPVQSRPFRPGHPTSSAGPSGEPGMDDVVALIRRRVVADPAPVTRVGLAEAVQQSGRVLGTQGALAAVDRVRAELQGLGPLQPLAEDPTVTDILVNAPDQVWTEGHDGLALSGLRLGTETEVRALAVRLVAAGGRRLDDASPCADVQLGPYRIHAVLPPVSTAGTVLSVRIRRSRVLLLPELVAGGMVDEAVASVLQAVIARRLNFLISGATGTGKTTLLAAMLSLCGPRERIVVVEDASELRPDHPHVLGLQSRRGNIEGSGGIDLADLVRQALRMRPDRLVVGECRGGEVRELLAAMNTGHDGAGGTLHANSAEAVPARLAALGALAGMSQRALELQAGSALDVLIHLTRTRQGRQVGEVALLRSGPGGLSVSPALIRRNGAMVPGAAKSELDALLSAGGP